MDLKTWLRAQWDRVLGALGVGVGILALALGYRGVADTPFPAEQIPYVVSGAVLGIVLIGIGLTSWLSADLRDEWRKLDRIERLLERGQGDASTPNPSGEPAVTVTTDHAPNETNGGNGTASGVKRRAPARGRKA